MTTQCCTHMYICCITSCERTLYILYTHSTNTVCMSLYNTIQHSIHVRPNVHMRPKYDTAPSHKPVRVEHIWVCPHLGVIMNSVNEQENCNTFLERDTLQHTVLVAQASKAGSQQEIKLQPMLHKLPW